MTNCPLCVVSNGVFFEDEICKAIVPPLSASLGHLILFPKKHYQIIEQVPDYEIGHLFNIANKLSVLIFESLKVQGTNIIIHNGVSAGQLIPHFCIHIIPRSESDNLNFEWTPKKISQQEMLSIASKIKKSASDIGPFQKEKKKESIKPEKKVSEKLVSSDKENNYLLKKIKRIP